MIASALAAVGAAGALLHGYGISLRVPPGFHGRISAGVVAVANFPIPRRDTGFGRMTSRRLRARRGSLLLLISEYEPTFGERVRCLPRRHPNLLDPGDLHGSSFCLSHRHFVLFVRSRQPDPLTVLRSNVALSSLRVAPGDFYPGRVRPARFPARPGWHVGSSGPQPIRAQGMQTGSWAATVPYRDHAFELPPHKTFVHFPRDGIAIYLGLWHDMRQLPWEQRQQGSLRISRALDGPFEGVDPRIGLYRASVPHGRYVLDLWVFFGTNHPSRAAVARAQAELDAVRLPIWPKM